MDATCEVSVNDRLPVADGECTSFRSLIIPPQKFRDFEIFAARYSGGKVPTRLSVHALNKIFPHDQVQDQRPATCIIPPQKFCSLYNS